MRLMLMPFFSASRLTVPVTLVSSTRAPPSRVRKRIGRRKFEMPTCWIRCLRAPDQAGRPVLQVGQRRPCRRHRPRKPVRIGARQRRIGPARAPDSPPTESSRGDLVVRGLARPTGAAAASAASASSRDGLAVEIGGMDIHGGVLSVQAGHGRLQCLRRAYGWRRAGSPWSDAAVRPITFRRVARRVQATSATAASACVRSAIRSSGILQPHRQPDQPRRDAQARPSGPAAGADAWSSPDAWRWSWRRPGCWKS